MRLYNEVWSNTAVVGAYYGKAGEWSFIGAALLFTAATLCYSIKGGLRSSIFTDAVQGLLFVATSTGSMRTRPDSGRSTKRSCGIQRCAATSRPSSPATMTRREQA